jgi:large subunit ribosomal protein L13
MKTTIMKLNPTTEWVLIDASNCVLGRLASKIAMILSGKTKSDYTAHLRPNLGVIVINARLLKYTGKKLSDKIYYRHSGYTGNLKKQTLSEVITKDPTKPLLTSVKGMLSRNKLRAQSLKNLRIFSDDHDMYAQKPVKIK